MLSIYYSNIYFLSLLLRNQRNKLKLDHLAPSHISISHGQAQKEYNYSNNKSGLRHQRSSDNMSSMGPYATPMFVPNVHIENAATLLSPSLPCQRKTSSAEDMMMRKNSSVG